MVSKNNIQEIQNANLRISTLCCKLRPWALRDTSLVNVVAASSWA